MFNKGEYVVCGNKGVCTVEDVTTLNISGVDKAKLYYILKPQYITASTVYVPVDSDATSMRAVLTGEEARELVNSIPDLPPLHISNEKLVEQEYRSCMRTNDCQELVKLIKTIYSRKMKRIQNGRKETSVDSRYFKLAEDNLYGELAVALGMPKEEVSHYIMEQLEGLHTM